MSANTKKKQFVLFCAGFLILAFAAGCEKAPTQPNVPGNPPSTSQPSAQTGQQPSAQERTYVLYRADARADKLVAELVRKPDSEQPEKRALELLLSEPVKDRRLTNVMPKDVRLLDLTIRDKIAYADFSKELKTNALGGAAYEMLLVNGIVNTLTEFKTIERVQLLINGRAIATINGHMDLTDPIERDQNMIKQP